MGFYGVEGECELKCFATLLARYHLYTWAECLLGLGYTRMTMIAVRKHYARALHYNIL